MAGVQFPERELIRVGIERREIARLALALEGRPNAALALITFALIADLQSGGDRRTRLDDRVKELAFIGDPLDLLPALPLLDEIGPIRQGERRQGQLQGSHQEPNALDAGVHRLGRR